MNLFDLHCDTASELYAQKKSLAENDLHIDLARLCAFPRCAQLFAVWTPPELSGKERTDHALRVIDYFRNELEKNSKFIALCTSAEELDQTLSAGRVAALLGIEGGGALDGSLENLRRLHSLGVRVLTLTWNGKNELGAGNPDPDGLSPFGEKALAEMEALGVIADLSHANPATFRGALEHSSQPLIASHSNASEVFDHPRNLFPADRARLAQRQGVQGLNLCPCFVGDPPRLEDLVDHAAALCQTAPGFAALGCDLDGIDSMPEPIRGVQDLPLLYEAVSERLGEEAAQALFFQNAYSFFHKNLR